MNGHVVDPRPERVGRGGEADSVVLAVPRAAGVEAVVLVAVVEDERAFDAVPRFPDAALVVALALVDLPLAGGADDDLRRRGC
jgi:hypothetical protein